MQKGKDKRQDCDCIQGLVMHLSARWRRERLSFSAGDRRDPWRMNSVLKRFLHALSAFAPNFTEMEHPSASNDGVSGIVKWKCDICKNGCAKYKCPGCSLRTCCLPCVKLHKQQFNCSGVRNKTKFVSLEQFDDMTLLSDYRLLEETSRTVDNSLRHPIARGNPYRFTLPYWKNKLAKECNRRQIRLMIMPTAFQRSKSNTTYLKGKNILWRIEWIFSGNLKFTDSRVPEGNTLQFAVHRYFDLESTDLEVTSKLGNYREANVEGSVPLLRKERMSKPKYIKLDWMKSVSENLRGNTIIEFPTIHVVLLSHISQYDIIEETGTPAT